MKDNIERLLKEHTGRSDYLAIPPLFVSYTGSPAAALLLGQIIYWSARKQGGWFYKSYKDWASEIFLSKKVVYSARLRLEQLGVIETRILKAAGAPTLHYKLIADEFLDSFEQFLRERRSAKQKVENASLVRRETDCADGCDRTSPDGAVNRTQGAQSSIPETTTYTTTGSRSSLEMRESDPDTNVPYSERDELCQEVMSTFQDSYRNAVRTAPENLRNEYPEVMNDLAATVSDGDRGNLAEYRGDLRQVSQAFKHLDSYLIEQLEDEGLYNKKNGGLIQPTISLFLKTPHRLSQLLGHAIQKEKELEEDRQWLEQKEKEAKLSRKLDKVAQTPRFQVFRDYLAAIDKLFEYERGMLVEQQYELWIDYLDTPEKRIQEVIEGWKRRQAEKLADKKRQEKEKLEENRREAEHKAICLDALRKKQERDPDSLTLDEIIELVTEDEVDDDE